MSNILQTHHKTIKMKNHRPKKQQFLDELNEIKDQLPAHYGVLLRTLKPDISKVRVDRVMQSGVVDREVLEGLKEVIQKFKINQ
jgi:hypothetical protein